MTCTHSSRCWIELYMYKEDLLWVWRGWGVLIISTNWESTTFCTHDIHSQVIESKYQAGASWWPVATVAGAESLYICVWRRHDESMRKVECLNHNIQNDTVNSYLTVNPIIYHAGVASLWPLAAVAGAEMHYIYMNLIFYEYEVDGMPQSWPTVRHQDTKRTP